MPAIAAHIRFAAIGEDLVVFDLRADRYVALPGAVLPGAPNGSLLASNLGMIDAAALKLLESEGMLSEGHATDPIEIDAPNDALEPVDPVSLRFGDAYRLAGALVHAGRLLRGYHCRTFEAPQLPAFTPGEQAACCDMINRLEALRLLVPTPRRCLPAAMVTAFFLRSYGIEIELVFGVRGHPFEAHCWLQRGALVIDDVLDRVRAYTPIAVGRL